MPRPLRSLRAARALLGALAFGAAATLAACDSAPGLPSADARPSVTAFALTPSSDSLGTDARTASVPLQLALTVAGTGPVRVRATVRYSGTDTLVTQTTVSVDPGERVVDLPVVIPRGAIGDYAVTVATEGPDRRPGDGASAVFRFRASSLGPPVVGEIAAAATVRRPANANAPRTRLPLVVAASDPDGRENLAVVVLEQPGVGIIGQLSDRGRSFGDATAGDGRYSGELLIPFDFPPDVYTLNAIAVDRAGRQSDPVPFTFTVE